MKLINPFRQSVTVSLIAACLLLSGCLSVPFDVAESVVDASLSVAETAVTTPFTVAGAIVDIPPDFTSKYVEEENWTFDSEGITLVEAEGENGSIVVIGTGEDRITIHSWLEIWARKDWEAENFADKIDIHISRDDNELRIIKKHPRKPNKVRISIRYEIRVPWSMDLNISTSNGAITAEGVDGKLHLHTTNGKIKLFSCGGTIDASSNNARIEADLNRLIDSGRFETQNGSISVSIKEGEGDIKIESHNGSIDLSIPNDFEGTLDAKTFNGSVHSNIPVLVRKARKNHLKGDIGPGGHNKVDLRTHNGSIHLKNSWE